MSSETLGKCQDVAALCPAGSVEWLQAIGHDFLEGKREGACVYDEAGRRYIDGVCGAGVFNLGRRYPELVRALDQAMRDTDQGNFPMISEEKALLGQALAQFVPGALECSMFSVMRGEAMDFACKVARGFTGRTELLTVDGGCYGQTGFALSLSERVDKEAFGPLIPDVRIMPFGDVDAAKAAIGERTAAVLLEPLQVENHCRAAASAYLQELGARCRACGAPLVLDETQTNFGRTGLRFAFEESGVEPDVLVLGEALGGGLFPIAATLITQRVNTFMNAHPMIHLSTFGGSDVGCCVALKALEIFAREQPWQNAAARGQTLHEGIEELRGKGGTPIRGVAGKGLVWSLDLGSPEAAQAFCRSAARHGLLVVPGQVARHTVVLRPSLLVTEAEAMEILDALRAAATDHGETS